MFVFGGGGVVGGEDRCHTGVWVGVYDTNPYIRRTACTDGRREVGFPGMELAYPDPVKRLADPAHALVLAVVYSLRIKNKCLCLYVCVRV